MNLPPYLLNRIDEVLKNAEPAKIKQAASELSKRYRTHKLGEFVSTNLHCLAYLPTRLPATYAVNVAVLKTLALSTPQPKSLLDLGAGPGCVMWAAASFWPELSPITLIEQDKGFIELGKFLSQGCEIAAFQYAQWQQENLLQFQSFLAHDLVSLSYVLGELEPAVQAQVIQKAWDATLYALIVIEPGTPSGFQRILKARDWLIEAGAAVFAPCPHNLLCPLQKDNWCHFSVRLSREGFHRNAKEAYLGFEDEKYSYVIARKVSRTQGEARIISKPRIRTGQVLLDLCTTKGMQSKVVLSKKNPLYPKARKAKWGDTWL